MKTKIVCLLLSIVGSTALASEALDWKKCDKEIKEFKCSGDDKAKWECLEKHDDKLGKSCQETHEKGDALFGKK